MEGEACAARDRDDEADAYRSTLRGDRGSHPRAASIEADEHALSRLEVQPAND
jgi:hypothetical protein